MWQREKKVRPPHWQTPGVLGKRRQWQATSSMGYKVDDRTFRAEGSKETLTKGSEWREAGREKQDGGRQVSLLNAASAAEMWFSYLAVHQGNY